MAAPIVDNRNQHPYQVVFRSPTANSLLRRGQPEPLPTRFPNNHTHNNMASFRSPKLLILTLISQTEMYSCTVVYSIHAFSISIFHCHFVHPRDNPRQKNGRIVVLPALTYRNKIWKVPCWHTQSQQTLYCSVHTSYSHTWTVSDQTRSGVLRVVWP
jgi:hypothetical protein